MSISAAAITACLWVVASAITALMPMRRQYLPGVTLLLAAPVLIGWLWDEHGGVVGALALLGFLSMFRNPLIYFGKRALGLPVALPKELQEDGK